MKYVGLLLAFILMCSVLFAQADAPKEQPKDKPQAVPQESSKDKPAPEQPKEQPKEEPKAEPQKKAEGLQWLSNLEEALKVAKEKGLKVVLLLTNPERCQPCRMLVAQTFPKKEVQDFLRGFVLVKLDAWGAGQKEAQKFNIKGIPTTIMLDPEGKEIGRVGGFRGPEDYLSALTELRDADLNIAEGQKKIKEDPANPAAYLQLAKGHLAKGNRDEAQKALEKAVEVDTKNEKGLAGEAYEKLAAFYADSQRFDKAIDTAEKLGKLDPENKSGLALKSAELIMDFYIRLKNEKKVVECVDKIVELDPKNEKGSAGEAYEGLVYFFARAHMLEKAIEAAQKMATLDPENKSGLALTSAELLMRLYSSMRNEEKWVEYAKKVIELDPANKADKGLRQATELGMYYARKGDAENMKECIETIKRMDPNDEKGYADQIELAQAAAPADKQEWDKAVANIKKFMETHKNSKSLPEAYWALGVCYYKGGRLNKTIETFDELIKKFPDSPEAIRAKQQVLPQLKKEAAGK